MQVAQILTRASKAPIPNIDRTGWPFTRDDGTPYAPAPRAMRSLDDLAYYFGYHVFDIAGGVELRGESSGRVIRRGKARDVRAWLAGRRRAEH